jgi:hypothetical protein
MDVPPEILRRIADHLDAVHRMRLARLCRSFSFVRMSESRYVLEVKRRFVTTAPAHSGALLAKYLSLGFVLNPEHPEAAYWFR